MSKVSKHTNSDAAQTRATKWLDTRAVIGWLRFEREEVEVISLTEAGQAAHALALQEDSAAEPSESERACLYCKAVVTTPGYYLCDPCEAAFLAQFE